MSLATCLTVLSLLVLSGAQTGILAAEDVDRHAIYEGSCAGCHEPHAGDFVRNNIDLVDGNLLGRSTGLPVRAFLEGGHGRLSSEQIELIVAHLGTIRTSGFVFRNKCAICHVSAVELARRELILRDGVLTGRYSGRTIAEFLADHGRLTTEEVPDMVTTLSRQLPQD